MLHASKSHDAKPESSETFAKTLATGEHKFREVTAARERVPLPNGHENPVSPLSHPAGAVGSNC